MSLSLGELLEGTKILRTGGAPDVLAVRLERRQLAQGNVFFKLRSSRLHMSAADAIRRGAESVVLEAGDEEEATLPPDFPYAVVDDVNAAYARTCARLFEAHRHLTLIGVTGAKGKTTVCHLIDAALRASGLRSGLVSSLVFRLPDSERPTERWVPDTLTIHGFLGNLRAQGGTHAVIELASLGIAEDRLYGLQFDALAFTNHGSGDAHLAANRRLLTDPDFHRSSTTLCAFNGDDPTGRELAKVSPGRVVTFGFGDADVTPERYAFDRAGISMRLNGHDLRFPLIGRHNAENILAAAAILGGILPSEGAAVHLQTLQPLPARLERLPAPAGVDVYLDQPYMPANIEASLAAVREFAGSRRIVCVIGCAGGVDKALRPLRATAAVNAADLCILTIDDTQDEHPGAIVMDMLKGVRNAPPDRWKTILHRPTAIATAIREASPDGIVVLMGRRANGAELRDEDRHLAMDALHQRLGNGGPPAAGAAGPGPR